MLAVVVLHVHELPLLILLSYDNTFDAVNPLSFGVGEAREFDDPYAAGDLGVGDFDNDGRTDVVALHGYDLEVSWAGGSDWFPLNSLHATFVL